MDAREDNEILRGFQTKLRYDFWDLMWWTCGIGFLFFTTITVIGYCRGCEADFLGGFMINGSCGVGTIISWKKRKVWRAKLNPEDLVEDVEEDPDEIAKETWNNS